MRIGIAAYGISNSARALRDGFKEQGHRVMYRRPGSKKTNVVNRDVIINWGLGNPETLRSLGFRGTILNQPSAVNRAGNKLLCLRDLENANISAPDFTTNRSVAETWLAQGHRVYCRTTLRGHSGNGIVVARTMNEMVQAPLYTKGIDVRHEYRFHVNLAETGQEIFDAVRKAWSGDVPEEERNMDVRNHANGSIFVRNSRSLERALENTVAIDTAVGAVRAAGLDFGAVDLVEDSNGNFYVLEINTACGLEGTTLENYLDTFQNTI